MADHYQDRKFHEASNGWQQFHDNGRGWSPPHGDRIARMQNFQERNVRMQYHEEKNARIPYCDDKNEEKQYQESQQMIQTGEEVVLQMSQIREDFRHMHENYRQMFCELDNMIEICRELVQEESKNMQNQKIELLDLSSEIESIDFKKLHLVSENTEIKEGIEKLTAEQELVKIFSDSDGFYYDTAKTFDKKLERKLVDDVFFLGCGRCFNPGKKLFFLEETFSNLNQCSESNTRASDVLNKLESMELKKLQLSSENAKNKAREVIGMSKSEKASPVVLAIWRMTDGGFNQVSVLRKISWRANMNLKLHLLKYLVVLRHRWRWKDGVL